MAARKESGMSCKACSAVLFSKWAESQLERLKERRRVEQYCSTPAWHRQLPLKAHRGGLELRSCHDVHARGALQAVRDAGALIKAARALSERTANSVARHVAGIDHHHHHHHLSDNPVYLLAITMQAITADVHLTSPASPLPALLCRHIAPCPRRAS
jgi:hypothetical protein